jgi:hypothetical protein
MTKLYTAAELREFDRITMQACSRDQMDRIRARLDYSKFFKQHGGAKCLRLTVALKDRDNKRRRSNG